MISINYSQQTFKPTYSIQDRQWLPNQVLIADYMQILVQLYNTQNQNVVEKKKLALDIMQKHIKVS